jgi:hypothetical protein
MNVIKILKSGDINLIKEKDCFALSPVELFLIIEFIKEIGRVVEIKIVRDI